VAPAAIAYAAGMKGFWDILILIYFVACGVSRLARFNITAEQLSGRIRVEQLDLSGGQLAGEGQQVRVVVEREDARGDRVVGGMVDRPPQLPQRARLSPHRVGRAAGLGLRVVRRNDLHRTGTRIREILRLRPFPWAAQGSARRYERNALSIRRDVRNGVRPRGRDDGTGRADRAPVAHDLDLLRHLCGEVAEILKEEGFIKNYRVLDDPKVDAVFGLHVTSRYPVGVVGWRPGGMMAAVDTLTIPDRRISILGNRAKLLDGAPMLVLPPWAMYSVLDIGSNATRENMSSSESARYDLVITRSPR